uniref:Uncharacterized protein n=1 Tax=Solanum lycopersicum TaxID=4081 RepID=A0A3Q7IFU2_SOLLC
MRRGNLKDILVVMTLLLIARILDDEVIDPAPRKKSTKVYFDPTAKKKGVNIKLKPNEKERIRAHCKKKGCP